MSANLGNSAALVADPAFNERVQAAVVEHAITLIVAADIAPQAAALARRAVYNPTGYLPLWVGVCADDATISTNATATSVVDADLRRVITNSWDAAARVLAGLG